MISLLTLLATLFIGFSVGIAATLASAYIIISAYFASRDYLDQFDVGER